MALCLEMKNLEISQSSSRMFSMKVQANMRGSVNKWTKNEAKAITTSCHEVGCGMLNTADTEQSSKATDNRTFVSNARPIPYCNSEYRQIFATDRKNRYNKTASTPPIMLQPLPNHQRM